MRFAVWQNSFIGSLAMGMRALVATALFLGLALLSEPLLPGSFVMGSYGALCVVLVALSGEAVAKLPSILIGHGIAVIVGYALYSARGLIPPYAITALSVGLAVFAMTLTGTIHPPAGAVAFIAVGPQSPIDHLGWLFLPIGGLAGPLAFVVIHRIAARIVDLLLAQSRLRPTHLRSRPNRKQGGKENVRFSTRESWWSRGESNP